MTQGNTCFNFHSDYFASMARNQKWLWLILCIALFVLVGALGTSWNLVILNNYEKMVGLAEARWGRSLPEEWRSYPWWTIGLGTFGFLSILALSIVVTWKLLLEMKTNQAQSEFLALISHELKSPIATLELSANLLEAGIPKNAKNEKLWLSHNAELQRLKIEIERLLTASRWENVHDRPHLEAIDLVSWIQARKTKWTAVLGAKADLKFNLAKGPLWIMANSDYLELIANNFLDNARKFAKDGQAEVQIELQISENQKSTLWQLNFKDQGAGFDPKLRRKLFKRFYRAPTFEKRTAGSGLGLYLVKKAAKKMKFKIQAESLGLNTGSTFSLSGELHL